MVTCFGKRDHFCIRDYSRFDSYEETGARTAPRLEHIDYGNPAFRFPDGTGCNRSRQPVQLGGARTEKTAPLQVQFPDRVRGGRR